MDESRTSSLDDLLDGPRPKEIPFIVFSKTPHLPPEPRIEPLPEEPAIVEGGADLYSPYLTRDNEGRLCIKNPFIERIVRRDKFAEVASASESRKVQKFLGAMGDLKYAGWSMTRLAAKFGLGPADFAALWRDYHLQESFLSIAEGMPATAADIVRDSRSIEICCPRCDGIGQIERSRGEETLAETCPLCKGAKIVFRPGDHSSRVLMWKRMGWLKDGGSAVQVNINTKTTLESVLTELEEAQTIDAEFEPSVDAEA